MKQLLALTFALALVHTTTKPAMAIELPDLDGPDNFWECILDKVPGSSYGVEFRLRVAECRQEFPYNERLEKKTTYFFGLFNNPTAAECVAEHTGDTPSRKARNAIAEACMKIYPVGGATSS